LIPFQLARVGCASSSARITHVSSFHDLEASSFHGEGEARVDNVFFGGSVDRFLEFFEIMEENFKPHLKLFTSIDGNVVSGSGERLGNGSLKILKSRRKMLTHRE
jgi:hypothetical protein